MRKNNYRTLDTKYPILKDFLTVMSIVTVLTMFLNARKLPTIKKDEQETA